MIEKLPVTVVVSVKNEEKNIGNCLDRLSYFDEVIVVDSNSTDTTAIIVSKYDCRYVNFIWNGKYPKKRNWTLFNVEFRNDWVLFLDADEFVTDDFVLEINTKIKNSNYSGFWLTYDNYFMGKRLKFGDKMSKLAMFKKSCGHYEKVNENNWSKLDMEVHEHPVINGNIGNVKSSIIHKDFKNVEKYIERHNFYSSWEANRYLNLTKDMTHNLTYRQKLKYRLIELGMLSWAYFYGSYLFKLGFLDGRNGLYLARLKRNYFFQIELKIKENKLNKIITH